MARTDPALSLPISEPALNRVLNEAHSLATAITGFQVPQLAALIVLQYLPKIANHGPVFAERILFEAIKAGQAKVERDGSAAFADEVVTALDRAQIRTGQGLLADLGISLLHEDPEPREQVILPSGQTSYLTAQQSRIYREIRAQSDDHIHVQGYAGTGKSYLIKSLLSTLRGANVLVLAERQAQLAALLAGVGTQPHVHPRRFDALAREMIPTDLTDPINFRLSRPYSAAAPIADEVIIRHLGIRPSGTLRERDLVIVIRGTVASFCYSGDAEIEANHIPDRHQATLDATARQVVLHHATELWKSILLPPSGEFQPPVRGEHRMKWAAIKGWKIPARYTHVLIDESHDLNKPLLQILDISPQSVISLGDEYQNLQGKPQRRANIIRQRAVTSSVRSGRLLEGVVNPIIGAHPGTMKEPFVGNPLHRTEIVYYDRPSVPEQPAAILVGNTWSLFEWAQRLAAQNLDFELLSSRQQLNMFVNDCIELRRHGSRPRHGEIFRFGTWEALANTNQNKPGFQRIDRMLEKGYDDTDWRRTANHIVTPAKFALGLVGDMRNREFASVMLAPELVDGVWEVWKDGFAAASAALYVAVTRAQQRLIVPARLQSWLEEVTARRRDSRLHIL
ncbi:AAA family ATPase [Steroidobacter sp.]|uniref:AAA family ATPase n=1 Tax=Steroidobacter sp. TaxID=1978227 RepID=UPI001A58E040|nr:AAA family ATPase [Steroidobacter sp.]MBL8267821.1 hypothetical protein [Steroidobacter sp.]